MKTLFTSLKSQFSSLASSLRSQLSDSKFLSPSHSKSVAGFLRGDDVSDVNAATLTSAFHQSTWIYACITTLAENISGIPFRIVGERNEAGADAAARLFEHPHRHLDRFAFWELVVAWLCLRGEAFIFPLRDSSSVRSVVKELVLLSPDQMREIIINHELAGWQFTGSGSNSPLSSTVLLPEEVVHIRLPNPFNLWRGMSPLTVAHLAAQTDYAASQFMKGAMINNLDTGVIVTTDRQLSPDQSEAIRSALRERKRKAGTADRPLLLWGGAKIEKPTVSAVDLDFLENRKFNRQEICAIYKVPQELLGYTEDANRSVSEVARLNFFQNRIAPLCKRLEAGIDPIVKMFGRELRGEFQVKTTPVMQAAQRARIDSGLKLFGVGVPLNVVNQVLDLGLPELAHGERSFLSGRYEELGVGNTDRSADRLSASGAMGSRADKLSALQSRKGSREVFEQRCRTLAALEKGRPQIEAMIADAIQRGEPQELIARRVREYFNTFNTFNTDKHGLTRTNTEI